MAKAGVKAERIARDTHFELDESNFSSEYSDNERAYLDQVPELHRKRFAQFFTPLPIAKMMSTWVLSAKPNRVLDPAVGPGVFPAVLRSIAPQIELTLVDLDPHVLQVAKHTINPSSAEFVNEDFLSFDVKRTFDGIVANPPYLRHHDFSYTEDIFSVIGQRSSVGLSKLTNLYGLFLLEVGRRLNPGGRAAVIIPTEWTNANFGKPIKNHLLNENLLHTLIYFSHESLPFSDALTTASVLLLEKPLNKKHEPRSVKTIYLKEALSELELARLSDGFGIGDGRIVLKDIPADVLRNTKKWDYLIKTDGQGEKPSSTHLGDLASTKRGIATGANEFFHLSMPEVEANHLSAPSIRPCVGRAVDVAGLCFTGSDFNKLVSEQRRTHLVTINEQPNEVERAYLEKGERLGLHERYLLAARKRWYQMENRPVAPIWAAVFGRSGLRFVRNKAKVLNLTAFHCVYPRRCDEIFLDALVVSLNSRLVQSESAREHRVYGGGLLKAEPKDLLDMWVPPLEVFDQTTLERLAGHLPLIDSEVRAYGQISEETFRAIDALIEHGLACSVSPQKNTTENLAFNF